MALPVRTAVGQAADLTPFPPALHFPSLRRAIKEAYVAVTKPSTRFKVKLAGVGLAAAAGMVVLVR